MHMSYRISSSFYYVECKRCLYNFKQNYEIKFVWLIAKINSAAEGVIRYINYYKFNILKLELNFIVRFFKSKYSFLGLILLLVNEVLIMADSVIQFEKTQNLNGLDFGKMIINAIILIVYYIFYLRYRE